MHATTLQQIDDRPSLDVIKAVAEADDVDPLTMKPPLGEAVDPDALDRLLARGNAVDQLSFDYRGYSVTVRADSGVELQ